MPCDDGYRTRREEGHVARNPDYPGPFYLDYLQKYLFRSEELRSLRVEQVNRYFSYGEAAAAVPTMENTLSDDEDGVVLEKSHRHYAEVAERVAPGTVFVGRFGVGNLRRRKQERLGVARTAFLEPAGDKREPFYEQRLALALPWYCPAKPEELGDGGSRWRVIWDPPPPAALGGAVIPLQELLLEPGAAISYEQRAADLEAELCCAEHDLVCRCCLGELVNGSCDACRFAVGLHHCQDFAPGFLRWKKGCLHAGSLDCQRVLFNLHRKGRGAGWGRSARGVVNRQRSDESWTQVCRLPFCARKRKPTKRPICSRRLIRALSC